MKFFFRNIFYLVLVHCIALMLLMIFRTVLFCLNTDLVATETSRLITQAFLMGLRFDDVMSCYVMILPVFVVGITSCLPFNKTHLNQGIYIFLCVFYSLVFLASIGDIPYFQQFFKHINSSIWNWFDEPSFVITMITMESSYVMYLIAFIVFDILFCWGIKKLQKRIVLNENTAKELDWKCFGISTVCTVLLVGLCIIGMRGRLGQKSPIRIGTAYFCSNPFLNQLGLNPMYVLLRTSLEINKEKRNKIKIMDEQEAVQNARAYFNLSATDTTYLSPIARQIVPHDKLQQKKNVVVVMMESMASHFVADTNLTPFLNSLIKKSMYFPNTYSAGIHTMNGVFGTLFSFPAFMNQHPFKTGDIQTFDSWPVIMSENGYNTYYFSTHDEQFDNIGGYLSANYINTITAEKDYPYDEIKSNLGVTDDFMFRFSLPILERAAQNESPFFASYLTATNHAPYVIPDYFHPKSESERYQVIEFSDYSLQKFFEAASKEPWFKNTLFVLLGDHGASNNDYDVPLSYHQIPLIIYDPNNETPQVYNTIAGQIDAFPTVMGLLHLPYVNNTFGVDLLNQGRNMIFFSSDDSYCCVDSTFYYVHRNEGKESLYLYNNHDTESVLEQYPEKAAEMGKYARSMIQTSQYMITNKMVRVTNDNK